MCRHTVAPLAWERGSHEIEKLAPGGGKRSPRGVEFRAPGGPKWLCGGLWRPPGASWAAGEAQEGALSGKGSLLFFFEKAQKVFFGASRVHLGELLAAFGSILEPFPPPGGGPGRLREVIFGGFVRVGAREVKNREK